VRIDWQAPGTAPQRYIVTRRTPSGSAESLPELDAQAVSAIDIAVQPRTTYRYAVAAHYGPAKQPGESEPVEVTTPVLLPPAGFRLQRGGAAAIRLSWQPRAAAVAYQVTRNGTTFPVRGSSHEDAGLAPGDYTYTIRTIVRLPSGAEALGEISNPLTLRLRPFNMVAAGDSVMWGQGLTNDQKFTFQVRNWIQGILRNKPVVLEPYIFAHSGAIIGEPNMLEEPAVRPGEVPASFPSIRRQLLGTAPTRVNPREVDLILLDGCINDVTVNTITLDGLVPYLDQYAENLKKKTENACYRRMKIMLQQAAALYPNAKFVITGYFPIASDQTGEGEAGGPHVEHRERGCVAIRHRGAGGLWQRGCGFPRQCPGGGHRLAGWRRGGQAYACRSIEDFRRRVRAEDSPGHRALGTAD
jgi:hypothetical protein